jgi:hypothetical protein
MGGISAYASEWIIRFPGIGFMRRPEEWDLDGSGIARASPVKRTAVARYWRVSLLSPEQ